MTLRLLYIANIRLPTEKAHGLQIMQNCEAFAEAGAQVTLWVARRVNTRELSAVTDVWGHYGVRRAFTLRRLPCLDLLPLVPGRTDWAGKLAFYLQQATFIMTALLLALFTPVDVIYSRDAAVVLALSWIKPRKRLVYEAHMLATGRAGRWMQRQVVRRAGTVIAVTGGLARDLQPLAGEDQTATIQVAHDGIRAERFAGVPDQAVARARLGWPMEAFIVGYVGRLQTLAQDKGVGTLVEALRGLDGVTLALVGGPDEQAAALRQTWISYGLDEGRFLSAGQVAPDQVPLYLSAFDVCAMPFPFTPHFAHYASPMKLFEYMASRRALVASALPSTAEVVQHEVSALLVPPSDPSALREAIRRLRDDPALRQQLAETAYETVMRDYTWEARARAILGWITPR